MRATVDKFDDSVKGIHVGPTTFSITGNYIVELPTNFLDVSPLVTPVSSLITEKENAYLALSPNFAQASSEEFLDGTGINFGASSGCVFGSDSGDPADAIRKGTEIRAGGTLALNLVNIGPTNNFFVHMDIFQNVTTLDGRKLYNFDGSNPIVLDPSVELDITLDDGGGAGATTITLDSMFVTPSGGSQNSFTITITALSKDIMVSGVMVLSE